MELYGTPYVGDASLVSAGKVKLLEWPRYINGEYVDGAAEGESMLEMTDEEAYSLSLIVLKTECRKDTFAGIHGFSWKKVGLLSLIHI